MTKHTRLQVSFIKIGNLKQEIKKNLSVNKAHRYLKTILKWNSFKINHSPIQKGSSLIIGFKNHFSCGYLTYEKSNHYQYPETLP